MKDTTSYLCIMRVFCIAIVQVDKLLQYPVPNVSKPRLKGNSWFIKKLNPMNIQETVSTMSTSTLPSICIPRVFANITRKDVADAFEKVLGRNCIERIDMIYRRDGLDGYQRVFVHFKDMDTSPNYLIMSKRLKQGKHVNVVYSEPWFWKCSVSRVPKPNRY